MIEQGCSASQKLDASSVYEEVDTGLRSLLILARFHKVAADMACIRRELAISTPLGCNDILRAARFLGFKSKVAQVDHLNLVGFKPPFIVALKGGQFGVVGQISTDKVLILSAPSFKPTGINLGDFALIYSGSAIYVTKRTFATHISHFGLGWFTPALIKHKKLLGEVILASFFIQLFALLTPLFFQIIIDKVLVHQGLTTLDVLAFGLLAISLFDVILNGLRTYLFSHTTQRIDVGLGAKLFNHLVRLPIAYFESRQVGTTVARVRELETIRNFITGSALTLVIDLFFTVVFFAVMYHYSMTLFWIVLGSIPFYVLLSIFITPILRKRLDEKFARGAENQAFLVESVSGIETLKATAVEPQMQRRWEEQLAGYVAAAFRSQNLNNVAGQVAQFINKVVVVMILWFGARLVILGEISVGQLIAFNMLAGRVSAPILRLVQIWQDFQQVDISIKRLGDILNSPAESGHDPNRTTLPNIQGKVQLEHVSFRYHPDRPQVLNNVSLSVKPGEVIGIVGRSGSGKSTLTKLIQRLYVPELGRVLVDGVDLALVQPAWLRRQVGVVLQENFLFSRSVKDNIALADSGMPIERVMQAARLAGAHDFILELPEGYDTKIQEQGSNLSGGQKQRIAIARALITNPRILIFDEATSALDYESEYIIQRNMQAICQNRTVFIIAHRLSAVRDANRIMVLDKGQIVEAGSHDALLKHSGLYAKLHFRQSGGREDVA